MKGFIYLLEITIALILMLVVLGTLSSFKSKENWERNDLITTGNNIMKNLNDQDILNILNGNFEKIEKLKPLNIDYGLKIIGVPKKNIRVGCAQSSYCDYIKILLSNSTINNHSINFSVDYFDASIYIPSYYDAVVFVNSTSYSSEKSIVIDYLKRGGVVIGINASYNNVDFNEIFGLSPVTSVTDHFNFTSYNPSEDEIQKYFFGLGFDVNTSSVIDSNRWGYWYIWEVARQVNITSSGTVEIENKTTDETGLKGLYQGDFFNLKGPDNNFYRFKVKKISWDENSTVFQPMNNSFIFKDFTETTDVTGKVNIVSLSNNSEMASNNTAIWISDFPPSHEYRTLVKAAIASRVKEWYIKEPEIAKEHAISSSFYSLCCDVPEVVELKIYLWYKI